MNKRGVFIICCIFFGFVTCRSEQNRLKGTWSINEIHWITPDTTYSIKNAQPGIFMVSSSRYSIIWTPIHAKRVPFKKLANPTDEEIISGFKSIVFNSGTYQIADTTFTVQAQIAKVPGFEGGTQKFIYNIKDDILNIKMIDETYPNGEKPDWFGKLETLFVMERID